MSDYFYSSSGNLTTKTGFLERRSTRRAVLPIMREQGDGQLIHTASWAGRFIGPTSGPIYTAAKHGVVAMSHTINLEECENGIRSTVISPGEVATPLMAKRNPPEPPEVMASMQTYLDDRRAFDPASWDLATGDLELL